jgi:SHS2 domain-containing protein
MSQGTSSSASAGSGWPPGNRRWRSREGATFLLRGRAADETINPNTHALGADVKGVTLHCLQVVQTANGSEATVILDV